MPSSEDILEGLTTVANVRPVTDVAIDGVLLAGQIVLAGHTVGGIRRTDAL